MRGLLQFIFTRWSKLVYSRPLFYWFVQVSPPLESPPGIWNALPGKEIPDWRPGELHQELHPQQQADGGWCNWRFPLPRDECQGGLHYICCLSSRLIESQAMDDDIRQFAWAQLKSKANIFIRQPRFLEVIFFLSCKPFHQYFSLSRLTLQLSKISFLSLGSIATSGSSLKHWEGECGRATFPIMFMS